MLLIQVKDDHIYRIPNVQQLPWMADPSPAQLRQVHQTISAAYVDKSTKGGQAADNAMPHLALPQLVEQPVALLFAPFALGLGRRQDQAMLVLIDLDHLDLHPFADHTRQPLQPLLRAHGWAKIGYLRSRDKAPDPTQGDHQTTFVIADHL